MTTNPEVIEVMYWMDNREWYTFDPYQDVEYHLTNAAPERARQAYAKWLELQSAD